MEATGVYHEPLAYFLYEQAYRVAILLPNRVKAFARSHNQFSKADEIDALIIARMALERSLSFWKPANKSTRQLRHLGRERQSLMGDKLLKVVCQSTGLLVPRGRKLDVENF